MPKFFCNAVAALLIAAFISSNAFAAAAGKKTGEPGGQFSLTPTVGGYLFAGPQNLDPAILYGLKASYDFIGTSIADSIAVEGTANYLSTKSTSKTDPKSVDGYILRADILYLITPRDKTVPFLAAGVGDFLLDNKPNITSSVLFNYGAGFKYFYEEWLALRVDFRQLFIYRDVNTRNNFELSLGLTYVFGKEHKKKQKATPEKKPLLAVPVISENVDETGLPINSGSGQAAPAAPTTPPISPSIDILELGPSVIGLPAQPPPFEVAPPAAGAPAAAAAEPLASVKAAETRKKQAAPQAAPAAAAPAAAAPAAAAPSTAVPSAAVPAPAAAAESAPAAAPAPEAAPEAAPASEPAVEPAPVIIPAPERKERAPKAPAAPAKEPQSIRLDDLNMELALVEIPEEDQPLPTSARTSSGKLVTVVSRVTVEFDFGSSRLRPVYRKPIGELGAAMQASPNAVVLIEGHTDSVGKADPNVTLSLKRATAVKNELIRQGIDGSRIAVRGYGFTHPTAKNSTKEGRQRNRRAVAVVTVVTLAPDTPAPSKQPK